MAPITRTCSHLALALIATTLATPALADGPRDLAAYVRARAADADGADAAAAAGYAQALASQPDSAVIAIRAYRAALEAGDETLALRAAAVLEKAGVAPADTALIALAAAARRGDRVAAQAALTRMTAGPLGFLVAPLRAWITYESDPEGASAALMKTPGDGLGRRYALEAAALIDIARGRSEAGLAVLRAQSPGGQGFDLRLAAARLLVAQGKRTAADELVGSDVAGAGSDAAPAKLGLSFGLARLMARLAEDLEAARAGPLGVVVARAALMVEPGNDPARLLLAQTLGAQGAFAPALAALDRVAGDGPYAAEARARRIDLLDDAGRLDEALAIAMAAAGGAQGDAEDAQRLGDLLAKAGREGEAADAYARAITRAGRAASWALYLQQGGALERAGRWREAEPLLERAVELAPDQPIALNYLGYARLEHGGDMRAARAMLERAVALKPDSPSILDSLAWAYFLGGDAARALPLMERAAMASPDNAIINEHLGDVYWSLGRRFEARYAWQAAAIVAEGRDSTRIAAKLDGGPGAN
ncbi:tetratricopeptide repeat protein [Sphingomonas sp.]|uniref:tetratricopeptide repeat protein n=1 Tax=Sphingomonas sp. TaxID=28214 RepID=UPI001DE106BB|nr:tetratricopeptide repeat protein [Sphingomonas sp.]MBX9795619.1 tetratricopeptide repeat protein [Sphingomonas sp.]